jgi:hypothetical protein
MHAAAQAAWQTFITKDEGNIPYMYLDTKMLITVGIGNLIDPVSQALTLPFQFKANNAAGAPVGRAATRQEIEKEWLSLKNHASKTMLARNGHTSCARLTSLELTAATRQRLFDRVTAEHETQLVTYFPDFAKWPADAQLGLMAMAWGLGKYFPGKWPKFTAACKKEDFDTASAESRISSWRAERNESSVRFFSNAARVVGNPNAYDRTKVYYPTMLLDTMVVTR